MIVGLPFHVAMENSCWMANNRDGPAVGVKSNRVGVGGSSCCLTLWLAFMLSPNETYPKKPKKKKKVVNDLNNVVDLPDHSWLIGFNQRQKKTLYLLRVLHLVYWKYLYKKINLKHKTCVA